MKRYWLLLIGALLSWACYRGPIEPACAWYYTSYTVHADTAGTYRTIPTDSVFSCKHRDQG